MSEQITPKNKLAWADGQKCFYLGGDLLPVLGGLWLLMIVLGSVVGYVLSLVNQTLLMFVVVVFTPIITVGAYNACHHARKQSEGGERVSFSHFFAGLKHQTQALMTLGVILLLLSLATESMTQLIFNVLGLEIIEDMAPALQVKNAFIGQMISFVVSFPVLVVALFSPQLIFFHNQTIGQALKGSYLGFLNAWRGLLMLLLMLVAITMVIMIIGTIISALAAGLGIILISGAIIILFSINAFAQYFAFNKVFPIVDVDNDSENNDENDQGIDSKSSNQFHTEI